MQSDYTYYKTKYQDNCAKNQFRLKIVKDLSIVPSVCRAPDLLKRSARRIRREKQGFLAQISAFFARSAFYTIGFLKKYRFLPQQNHLARSRKIPDLHFTEINAVAHHSILRIRAVPCHLMNAGRLRFIHQCCDFLTDRIINCDGHIRLLIKCVFYARLGIEWIRIILLQDEPGILLSSRPHLGGGRGHEADNGEEDEEDARKASHLNLRTVSLCCSCGTIALQRERE